MRLLCNDRAKFTARELEFNDPVIEREHFIDRTEREFAFRQRVPDAADNIVDSDIGTRRVEYRVSHQVRERRFGAGRMIEGGLEANTQLLLLDVLGKRRRARCNFQNPGIWFNCMTFVHRVHEFARGVSGRRACSARANDREAGQVRWKYTS